MKKIFISIVFLAPLLASAVSFDCSKATYPVEKEVCANPRLGALEEQMANLYKSARASSSNPDQLKADQFSWLKTLRACGANDSCIEGQYKSRIAALRGQPQSAAQSQPSVNKSADGYVIDATCSGVFTVYSEMMKRDANGTEANAAKKIGAQLLDRAFSGLTRETALEVMRSAANDQIKAINQNKSSQYNNLLNRCTNYVQTGNY